MFLPRNRPQRVVIFNGSSHPTGSPQKNRSLTSVLELPPDGFEGVGTTKVPVTDL